MFEAMKVVHHPAGTLAWLELEDLTYVAQFTESCGAVLVCSEVSGGGITRVSEVAYTPDGVYGVYTLVRECAIPGIHAYQAGSIPRTFLPRCRAEIQVGRQGDGSPVATCKAPTFDLAMQVAARVAGKVQGGLVRAVRESE